MLQSVIDLINGDKLEDAKIELLQIIDSTADDFRLLSDANYLLAYVYFQEDKKKNKVLIKRYLLKCINSQHPHSAAYTLLAEVIDDKNVTLNYLRKGNQDFPNSKEILEKLLEFEPDKEVIINTIEERGLWNEKMLQFAIKYFVENRKWEEIEPYVDKYLSIPDISELEKNLGSFIKALSLLFRSDKDCETAVNILETVIGNDEENWLCYAQYIMAVYAYIVLNRKKDANRIFDSIPVNNALCDFFDGPCSIITIDFRDNYRLIFDAIYQAYKGDLKRKSKAQALYSLYLYYPSELYGTYRYGKKDALLLQKYSLIEYNLVVEAALVNMYCHLDMPFDANKEYLRILKNYDDPDDEYLSYSSILEKIKLENYQTFIGDLIDFVHEDERDEELFASTVLGPVFNYFFEKKRYDLVRKLADSVSIREILQSSAQFKCAFSYGEEKNSRAQTLYEYIVKANPNESASWNNLGLIYEEKAQYSKAFDCFKTANELDNSSEIMRNNYKRIYGIIKKIKQEEKRKRDEEIRRIAKKLTLDDMLSIGYCDDLISHFDCITHEDMKRIFLRDLKECVVCILTEQNKAAIILCGSIIESVLIWSIQNKGVQVYDLSKIPECCSKSTAKPITELNLNQLLNVANAEHLLDKNNYHLGHYLRDYRDVVHVNKELISKSDISSENVNIMWSVLKRLIQDLLPPTPRPVDPTPPTPDV